MFVANLKRAFGANVALLANFTRANIAYNAATRVDKDTCEKLMKKKQPKRVYTSLVLEKHTHYFKINLCLQNSETWFQNNLSSFLFII